MNIRIGIIEADGVVESIACLHGQDALGLLGHYQDPARLRALLDGGDITALGEKLEPTPGSARRDWTDAVVRPEDAPGPIWHASLFEFGLALADLPARGVCLLDLRDGTPTWLTAAVTRVTAAGERPPESIAQALLGTLRRFTPRRALAYTAGA